MGQKNGRARIWAKRGTRPRLPADQRYTNAYLFGAICPRSGKGAALMLPFANTRAMQMHLDEISCNVAAKAHGVVLMDRAGWHSTGKLKVPKNLTIILLPSRSPELNPVENIWQYLRQNWLSNRVFEDYHAIIEAGCQAWNKLIDQPETIMSIGLRDWAHTGRQLMPLVLFRALRSRGGIGRRDTQPTSWPIPGWERKAFLTRWWRSCIKPKNSGAWS